MNFDRTMTTLPILLIFTLVLAGCGIGPWSPGTRAAQIDVDDAWARAESSGQNSAAYMAIHNTGDQADRLIGASAEIADAVEVHESTGGHGHMMKMREIEHIEIPAGGSATLEPGGLHVMFLGLRQDLTPGDEFTLSLTFERAGTIEVSVEVHERT
jgi:periplasmic copper chaperone A